jgi:hypothetical protein
LEKEVFSRFAAKESIEMVETHRRRRAKKLFLYHFLGEYWYVTSGPCTCKAGTLPLEAPCPANKFFLSQ